ncbi:MAG: helix-turn-helix domain-containing protein [Chloroflexota bacterium]|nr:helix-turn-helix domain-containing protein [Chloroflexota bacterium]
MTQAALGAPLTRGFVSAVETGGTVPSLPALALLADRLEVPLDRFFLGVKAQMTMLYNAGHEQHQDPTSRRRR